MNSVKDYDNQGKKLLGLKWIYLPILLFSQKVVPEAHHQELAMMAFKTKTKKVSTAEDLALTAKVCY